MAGQRRLQHCPDHLDLLAMALLALPNAARTRPILVRADSPRLPTPSSRSCTGAGLAFSIGFPLEPAVKQAIRRPPTAGARADQHDHDRPVPGVCELASLDLAGWPPSTCSAAANGPPGRQAEDDLHDQAGHCSQVLITYRPDPDAFAANDAWLTLVLCAQTLVC
jgi:hypothetical protein